MKETTIKYETVESLSSDWQKIVDQTIALYPNHFDDFCQDFNNEQEAKSFLYGFLTENVAICFNFDIASIEMKIGRCLSLDEKSSLLSTLKKNYIPGLPGGLISKYKDNNSAKQIIYIHVYGHKNPTNELKTIRHELSHLADFLLGIEYANSEKTDQLFQLIRFNSKLKIAFIGSYSVSLAIPILNLIFKQQIFEGELYRATAMINSMIVSLTMINYINSRISFLQKKYHQVPSEAKANKLSTL